MPLDDDAWQNEIANVKPLKQKSLKRMSQSEKRDEPAKPSAPGKVTTTPTPVATKPLINKLPPLSQGNFAGIDTATIRKLKRGQLSIAAKLDLHGMKQSEALDALEYFIHSQAENKRKLLLVVTGKGGINNPSVLKTNFPMWLNAPSLRPYILCFDQANPQHGGSGAFYVLLKKNPL